MKKVLDNNQNQQTPEQAAFKNHVILFIAANAMLWLFWYLNMELTVYPWPVYATIVWGLGILINYLLVNRHSHQHEKQHTEFNKREHAI